MATRNFALTVFASTASTALAGALLLKKSTAKQFDDIFNMSYSKVTCYDRSQFKTDLNQLISRPNPMGIAFVCGRLNGGKTTTIKAALANRNHIAYVNWREEVIDTPEKLNKSLKKAFQLQSFKDYWNKFWVSWIPFWLRYYSWLPFPSGLFIDKECTDLDETMDEIHSVLKFASQHYSGIKNRPVIFVDEIGTIDGLLSNEGGGAAVAKKFVKWLVRISKDEGLCDVVFSSNNGFMVELLNLADPQYCKPIVIPDFSNDDIDIVLKQANHTFAKTSHAKALRAKTVIGEVGGHAGHVMDILGASTEVQLMTLLTSLKTTERVVFDRAINGASRSCRPSIFSSVPGGCYEVDDFKAIMNMFINHNKADPEIPLKAMTLQTKVKEDVIREMVSSCYLFFDPQTNALKARNKLFLDVAKEEWNKQCRIDAIVKKLKHYEEVFSDIANAEEIRDQAEEQVVILKKELQSV